MKRFVVAFFVTLAFGLVVANAQTVAPTEDSNQQFDVNVAGASTTGATASVNQTLNVTVPNATALHSTAGSLTFDINNIGSQDATWACVQGAPTGATLGSPDLATGDYTLDTSTISGDFFNQTQVTPMGTYYELTGASWPNVTIVADHAVTQYPPIDVQGGTLVPGSKQYIVCYRTFILQTFSNWSHYDLMVERNDPASEAYPEPVYIQGNTYCSAKNGQPTGLFSLDSNSPSAHLIPKSVGVGPTGMMAEQCGQPGYKSWLDDLVVVAVKIDGEHYGTSTTQLTYTLTSADAAF